MGKLRAPAPVPGKTWLWIAPAPDKKKYLFNNTSFMDDLCCNTLKKPVNTYNNLAISAHIQYKKVC